MEKEIKKIEIDVKDDRYFQAVALLVDNPRFLKTATKLRAEFLLGELNRKIKDDKNYWIKSRQKAEELTKQFGFPNQFTNIIYDAIVDWKVSEKSVVMLRQINWSEEYRIAKNYKNTLLANYFSQKPFETKEITNFRQERDLCWKYIPRKYGFKKIAKETGINFETVKSAIKSYKKRINY